MESRPPFDPAEIVCGLPLKGVRDFLRKQSAWPDHRFDETDVAGFFAISNPAARRWLGRATARGLLLEHKPGYSVAPDGMRLAHKLLLKRLDRAAADRLVDVLLQRTETVAATGRDYLHEVTSLALFGSYIDPTAATVGDIDVLLSVRWRPGIADRLTQHCQELFKRDQRRSHSPYDVLLWPNLKLERFLRVRPYISLHDPRVDSVVAVTQKVRIIYALPAGRLAPPRDCSGAEYLEGIR